MTFSRSPAAPPIAPAASCSPTAIENRLSPALLKLARELRQAAKQIDNESERLDFTSAHDRLTALAGELTHWIEQQSEDSVYWIETITSRGRPRVASRRRPHRRRPRAPQ